MSPIIEAIDAGHVTEYQATRFTGGKPTHLVPGKCKHDGKPWPCPTIAAARADHARQVRHTAA